MEVKVKGTKQPLLKINNLEKGIWPMVLTLREKSVQRLLMFMH